MDLALQGNLQRFALAEIFQLLAAGRKTGTLGIQQDDTIVMVYFRDGEIIYGYGPRQTYHIGQILRERGLVSPEQLDEAISIQARTDNAKRLGEILISRGFVDRNKLEDIVRKQVEELLYSLLSWSTGSFKFYEDQFPTEEEITVRISVENVILEGLRRVDERQLVENTITNTAIVFALAPSQEHRIRQITLHSQEWNILTLVDGHRTVDDICRISPIERQDTLTKLAQLKLAGIITISDKRPSAEPANLEGMVNRLAGLFESYLLQKNPSRMDERIQVHDKLTGQ